MLLDSLGQVWAKDSISVSVISTLVADLTGTGTITANFPCQGVRTLTAPVAMKLRFSAAHDRYDVESMDTISLPLTIGGNATLKFQSGSGTFNDPSMTMALDFEVAYSVPTFTVNDFKTQLTGMISPSGTATLSGTGKFGPLPFDATDVRLTGTIGPRP